MIPANFDYHKAASVDEAIELLKKHGDDATLLAGGHSLLPAMKLRLSAPGKLIDIGSISELSYVREEGGGIAIGAASTHAMIEHSAVVQSNCPLLAENAGHIGDIQVRNRGTIGGSLAHADPASDYPAALLAANAEIVVAGPGGTRSIDAGDFFQGLYETALGENELITEVRVPKSSGGSAYMKFAQPASRFAIVGCAVSLTRDGGNCGDIRVAFNGVSSAAYRATGVEDALRGQALDEATIAAACAHAADGADLMDDHYASASYRAHLATVFAKRAIMEAAKRA